MFLRNISFRIKIFVIIFMTAILPAILVSTIIYIKSENAIKDQTSRTIISSIDYVIETIDSSLNAINDMSDSILTDSRLNLLVNSKNLVQDDRVKTYSGLRELLSELSNRIKNTYMLSQIDSYYLYIPSQKVIINSKSTYFENVDGNSIDFIQRLDMAGGINSWFVSIPFEDRILGFDRSRLATDKLLTFDKVLYDKDGTMEAVLAINVDINFVSNSFNKIQTGTLGQLIVLDEKGNLISHSDKSIIGEKSDNYTEISNKINELKKKNGSFFQKQGSEDGFVIYSISPDTNWRYITIIPASQIFGQVMQIQKSLIAIILIAVLLVLTITFLLSNIFYKPLEKIVSAMQEIENRNLNVRIDDNRGDEYHKVYKGFNNMVAELNLLLKDLTNEKILKKEAEIKLLQAQINPHFLYNTLESIYSIAKIKKVEEISEMASALSKFFRISLSGGKDSVTLKDAIELALNYLTIQNIRFNGKIDYNIEIPRELMECIVPKLILQPIVENSIYHGLEKKKGEGMLAISAQAVNSDMLITVKDNGIGISENDLLELKRSIENDSFEDSKNFALKNINRQIKLKYGQDYGINIDSVEGEGTCVNVKLPIIMEGGI